MFGAASLNSVPKIGPSSSNLVRAAIGRAGGVVGADAVGVVEGMVVLWSFMGAPPHVRLEQRLRQPSSRTGRLLGEPERFDEATATFPHCKEPQRICSRACPRKSHELG